MTEEEFVLVASCKDRLKEISHAIREIDPDRNGFVTNQELDDILRVNYGADMNGKHMLDVIKQFASEANALLIDYNLFKKWIYSKTRGVSMDESTGIVK